MASPTKTAVAEILRDSSPRAMHLGEICGRLKLRGDRQEVLNLLLHLVDEGLAQEMPGLRFRMPKEGRAKTKGKGTRQRGRKAQKRAASAKDQIDADAFHPAVQEGELFVTTRGFGFVAIDDGEKDAFIPAERMGPAVHGDRVQVRVRPSAKGREGRIVGVVRRRSPRISGTLEKHGRTTVLVPDDARLRGPMGVVGKIPKGVKNNSVVLADIVQFPQNKDERLRVEIKGVLGKRGAAEVEVEKIKLREGVEEAFPPEVVEEASAFAARVTRKEMEGRVDLRDLDLVTIDPETAKDHDDALWCKRVKDGFRIVVAIADVSHYVKQNSAIDKEAIRRGTSIYLPDRAIPMLPPELSTHLASLIPNRDRLCMAVDIHLAQSGRVVSYTLSEAVMRSHAKITYEGAARALGLTRNAPKQPAAEQRKKMLQTLNDAAQILRKRRIKRGALDFDLPEAKIRLDNETREPTAIVQSRADAGVRQAYRLVEEMMLLANEVVAHDFKKRGIPAIFRIHGKPDIERIEVFAKVAQSLGYSIEVEKARQPKTLAKFLKTIEDTPHAQLLRYLLLRSMQQALYDTDPSVGHFGLATEDYLHFTSPIRRYPDLVVHRMLRRVLREQPIDAALWQPRLQKMGNESSRLERRASTVERDVVDVYRAIVMRDRVGETFNGRIAGFGPSGIYVSIKDPFVDVLLPSEQLDDDYALDELGIRLIGGRKGHVFTLGDAVRVRIEDVRVQEGSIIGSLQTHEASTKGERSKNNRSRNRNQAKKRRGQNDSPQPRKRPRRKTNRKR